MRAATAGKGDPYWYEWTVGLLQIVEMLDPDSPVASVSLQLTGIKGWDDVVVRFKNGTVQMFQVKHSRVEDSLTFGDLVGKDEEGKTLLGELAKAWHEIDAPTGSTWASPDFSDTRFRVISFGVVGTRTRGD